MRRRRIGDLEYGVAAGILPAGRHADLGLSRGQVMDEFLVEKAADPLAGQLDPEVIPYAGFDSSRGTDLFGFSGSGGRLPPPCSMAWRVFPQPPRFHQ